MKLLTLAFGLIMLLTVNPLQAQDKPETGINFFQGTWEEVLAKAKKEKKPIFVDAYAVWCGPCKYMSYNVFPDEKVGEFFNKNFVNYKFDMEKGEGPAFSNKYQITAYPTFLFIDGDGNVQYRTQGGRQADAFIQVGNDALKYFKTASR